MRDKKHGVFAVFVFVILKNTSAHKTQNANKEKAKKLLKLNFFVAILALKQ
jgi:hypothetical protein